MEYTLVLRGRQFKQRSTHSKFSLNQVNVKKRQEICRNFQELHFVYSHFQFNRQFPKLRKEKKEKKLSFRSSLLEVFYKKGVLKNFVEFTGKLWHRCFSVPFARFLSTAFLKNTFRGCFCTLNKYLINYSIVFKFVVCVCVCMIQMLLYHSIINRFEIC